MPATLHPATMSRRFAPRTTTSIPATSSANAAKYRCAPRSLVRYPIEYIAMSADTPVMASATSSIDVSITNVKSAPGIGSHGAMNASRLGRSRSVASMERPAPKDAAIPSVVAIPRVRRPKRPPTSAIAIEVASGIAMTSASVTRPAGRA